MYFVTFCLLCARTHTANDKYDNTVTFALKMAMLTSQINVSPRFCEQCCSYQHKKIRRKRAPSSTTTTTTTTVVASSSLKRVDENKKTNITFFKFFLFNIVVLDLVFVHLLVRLVWIDSEFSGLFIVCRQLYCRQIFIVKLWSPVCYNCSAINGKHVSCCFVGCYCICCC